MVLSRVVSLHGLLRNNRDTTVFILLNTSSLLVDEACMFSRVLVSEVERIARELDTTTRSALYKVGILIACNSIVSDIFSMKSSCADLRTTSQMRSEETLGR